MWAALLHIRSIGEIDDEINFLNSGHSSMMLRSIEDYNARYGKYGVRIELSDTVIPEPQRTLEGPSFARRLTLNTLWKLKKGKRNLATALIIIATIGTICTVILFELGL
jgi:hypothetical protein